MTKISPLRAELAIPPLPLYFVLTALLFGSLSWIMHRFADADTAYGFRDAILSGAIFGGVMAGSVAVARWRLGRSVGAQPTPLQQVRMNAAIYRTQIPDDPQLRRLLPRYIKHYMRINRHSRFYTPIIFGLMTLLGIWLAHAEHSRIWLVYSGMFVAFAVIGLVGINRYLHRLQLLQAKLSSYEMYVSTRRIAPIARG